MRMTSIAIVILLAASFPGGPVDAAQNIHLQVGDPPQRMALVKPGVHRYLRYTVKDGERKAIDIWTRTISLEEHEGGRMLHIVQRWDEVQGPSRHLLQESWFEPGTFRPLTHVRTLFKDGKAETGGYRFLPDRIVGMKDLHDNVRRDFAVDSPEPAYNFEYDMELLQALPLREDVAFSIPFYDPGQEPPARYTFKVSGSDRLAGPDGSELDTWIVTADYNTANIVSRFWLDKRTQTVLREEQAQPDGSLLIKTLLTGESGDSRGSAGPSRH